MTRYLFAGDLELQASASTYAAAGGGTAPAGLLAPGAPFTLWDQPTGGNPITDVTAPDGITGLTSLVADASGLRPWMRGPDGVVAMYCDTGAAIRFPMVAIDAAVDTIQNAARLNQTLTQHFAGQVDFALAPTVNGAPISTGGGGTTFTTYSQVQSLAGYPAFIAAGSSALAARNAINATDLQIGTTSTTAKVGTYVPTWAEITSKPAYIAAGTTAALARAAIDFDNAAHAAVPYGFMAWNNSTAAWMAYDPATNTWLDGGPRPAVPPGMCFYDAVLYPAATLPTGAQAALYVANGPGDKFWLHENSPL